MTNSTEILQAFGVTDLENITDAVIRLKAGEIPTIELRRFIIDADGIHDLEEKFEIKRIDND